jgi:hypothetical protein
MLIKLLLPTNAVNAVNAVDSIYSISAYIWAAFSAFIEFKHSNYRISNVDTNHVLSVVYCIMRPSENSI